ncbi:8756_t:CDS:2, partial [Scutellospora calospora]
MYIQEPEYNKKFNEPEEVLNLSTNHWIKRKGKLYNRLLCEGYKYARDLIHYLEDILPIDLDEYSTIYPLADFYYPALIPPLSILAQRGDICRRYPITISSIIEGGMKFLENLTNNKKWNQARRRLQDSFKFSSEQVDVLIPNQRSGKNKTINLVEGNCRIAITKPPKSLEEEIIREKAKQILQNRYRFSEDQVNALFTILKNENKLSIRDIRAEAYALELLAKNANAGSSHLTRLHRELRNLNALLEIIESVNQKKAEAKYIDYSDEFILESVKERLDAYDIKTLPDCQALADVIVMLCIHPAELKTLHITDTGVTGYAKNLGKPEVKWFNKFLKDYDFIPKYLCKLGAVYSAVAHEAKNIAHAYTIARECLRHSSNNHTSPVQNYIVVNYRKRGDSELNPDSDEDSDTVSLKI